jgi:histidine triad (HIT) family protein
MSYDSHNAFAKILLGELPCIKICEDDDALAFMDIMPQADGHVLVIPKEPAAMIWDLSETRCEACIKMTRRLAIAVKVALDAPAVMIMQLNGEPAGQTVPHVHFHIVPRFPDIPLRAHAVTREDPIKLRRIANLIIGALPFTDAATS